MSADPRIGTELAGYRIERLLGRGGMSVVYLALDLRLKRRVALKLLAPELAEDARFRERFLRESELAASLDHQNVIPIYEAGEAGGVLYIAMRYVEGRDLKEQLHGGPLEPALAVSLLAQVAGALDTAHEHGLVHRDVKPGNVLIARDSHVYLSDFGLTKQTSSESGITETGQFVGTVDYVAPEQIERQPVDARTDGYALACVLYECLTGQAPYRSESLTGTLWAHVSAAPPSAHERRSELPDEIDQVIARGMAKKPGERYPTCGELVHAAQAALGLSGQLAQPAAIARPLLRRREFLAAAAIAVATAAAVPTVVLTRRNRPQPTPTLEITPTSLIRIDPATNAPVAAIDVGLIQRPTVAVGEGAVWLGDQYRRTVSRIDTGAGAAIPAVAVESTPIDIAVGAGAVWVVGSREASGRLTRLNPTTGDVYGQAFDVPYSDPVAIAAGPDAIWIAANDVSGNAILRLHPTTGKILVAVPFVERLVDVAIEDGAVWASTATTAASYEYRVARIDPATGRRVDTVSVSPPGNFDGQGLLALTEGTVWTIAAGGIVRLDAASKVLTHIPIAHDNAVGITATARDVWVAIFDLVGVGQSFRPQVWRIDAGTGTVVKRIPFEAPPSSYVTVAAGQAGVWAY